MKFFAYILLCCLCAGCVSSKTAPNPLAAITPPAVVPSVAVVGNTVVVVPPVYRLVEVTWRDDNTNGVTGLVTATNMGQPTPWPVYYEHPAAVTNVCIVTNLGTGNLFFRAYNWTQSLIPTNT